MSPEYSIVDSECAEVLKPDAAAYMAGVFESGGYMDFVMGYDKRIGKSFPSPILTLDSNEPAFLSHFVKNYGGRVNTRGDSSRWRLRERYKVANLAVAMEPFAVSRSGIISAIKEWKEVDKSDWEGRMAVVSGFKQTEDMYDPSFMRKYRAVVNNPAFVAGVVDRRGSIFKTNKGEVIVEVVSENLDLLTAIAEKHKGIISIKTEEGTEVTIKGKKTVASKNVHILRITCAKGRKFISKISDYLKIAPPAIINS